MPNNISRYSYANSNLTDKNISFKSGTQASLNALISDGGAVEGAFYLTTDTHRLYIGRTVTADSHDAEFTEKTIPIPVNEGISTVDTLANLNTINANAGEFYYISSSNILAVFNGQRWVQLNSDTNDTIETTGFNIVYDSENSTSDSIRYNWTLSQKKYDINGTELTSNSPSNLTGYFTIDGSAIADAVNVGIQSSAVANNSTTVSLTGNNADSEHVIALEGGNGVTLSGGDNSPIIISSKTYEIGSAATSDNVTTANITLTDSNSTEDHVVIKTGANLAIDNSVADEITIKHASPGTAQATVYGNNTAGSVAAGGSIIVPKIQKDINGHIASISDVSLSLPGTITNKTISASNTGIITITDTNDTPVSSGADLFYKITVDGTENTILNQNSLGAFYSTTEVDNRIAAALRGINALVYKGTIGDTSSTLQGSTLPTTNVSIGDTYSVNKSEVSIAAADGNKLRYAGDLFIATGTEDDNGYITSDTLAWTYIPAGQIDTTYALIQNNSANAVTLDLQETNGTSQGKTVISGGTAINVVGTDNDTKEHAITINHENVFTGTPSADYYGPQNSTASTLISGGTFTVPGFKVNAQGHIVGATAKTYTLPTSNSKTYKIANTLDPNAQVVSYDTVIRLLDENLTETGAVSLGVGNNGLTVTADGSSIKYSHASGTITATNNTTAVDVPVEGMTVVTGVAYDTYGHITGYNTNKYKIPAAVTYSLKKPTVLGTNTASWLLEDSNENGKGQINFKSDTLSLVYDSQNSTSENIIYSVDLKWDTF